ncbi:MULTISPECIES: hypothetical protein [Hyphomicrobiales]|uniref:hypothetical protein n=1 Tax=Hyphomicrobiales TaxID=356 RepID=UPI0011AEA707|nr:MULTISPECIES: hypothetical protein [Bradyrhizobium]
MNIQFFTMPGSRHGSRAALPRNNRAFSDQRRRDNRPSTKPVSVNRIRMVAVWRVNDETGRLECTWMPDDEADSRDDLRRMIKRLWLFLAVYQQGSIAA